MAWVLAAAGAVMAPALAHGASLGPFDIVARHGLSAQPGTVVHNPQTADLITEMIPWAALAWTQVHHGHLPLWNPYSALGMPLAFNWQSAAFGLPALLGYLAPLHLAYTVQVLVTLVVAGTGVYVLGRVLRLSALGCVMAATVYELSGPFFGWLGWPVASVMSWAGWLFAAAILVVRGRRRARAVTCFAVVVACAIYAGQPDTLVVLVLGLAIFVVTLLARRAPWLGGTGPILRPAMDLTVAAAAGGALGAPLLLPGLQLTGGAIRTTKASTQSLPLHDLASVVIQGFDGLPVAGSRFFGQMFGNISYLETATYVGVAAVVLAVVAVAFRRRRPEVVALGAVAVAMVAVVFAPPVAAVLDKLPYAVRWNRGAVVLAFALAVLAGVGVDVLVRADREHGVLRWAGGGFAVVGAGLAVLWVAGRGHLPPADAAIREHSFLWPSVLTAVGLAVIGALALTDPRRRPGHHVHALHRGRVGTAAGLVLLASETAFLVAAGAPLWSSSPTYLPRTPAEAALTRAVGSSLVGFGVRACELPPQVGIPQDLNAAYGVQEFDVYDPITPRTLFRSVLASTGQPAGMGNTVALFCPAITSGAVARLYGMAFVLEPPGASAPQGAVFDERVGDESLYRVPGAAAATLTPAPGPAMPPAGTAGTPVAVDHPDPASWRLVIDATGPQVLRLHLTAVPGWHATIDGRPLPLAPFSGAMLEARVPAGRHTVDVRYWPGTFTIGLDLAAAGALALLTGLVLPGVARHRRARRAGGSRALVPTHPGLRAGRTGGNQRDA